MSKVGTVQTIMVQWIMPSPVLLSANDRVGNQALVSMKAVSRHVGEDVPVKAMRSDSLLRL